MRSLFGCVILVLVATSALGVQPASAETPWTKCAEEGGSCSVSGKTEFRYGAGENFAYIKGGNKKNFFARPSITCDAKTFGKDPAPGETKQCWSR